MCLFGDVLAMSSKIDLPLTVDKHHAFFFFTSLNTFLHVILNAKSVLCQYYA